MLGTTFQTLGWGFLTSPLHALPFCLQLVVVLSDDCSQELSAETLSSREMESGKGTGVLLGCSPGSSPPCAFVSQLGSGEVPFKSPQNIVLPPREAPHLSQCLAACPLPVRDSRAQVIPLRFRAKSPLTPRGPPNQFL